MPVHVVVAGPDDARHRTFLDGAADTLPGHQFSKTLRQGKPEAAIADVVAATPAAHLVLGSYRHSALRTLLVGLPTTAPIRTVPAPVLLPRPCPSYWLFTRQRCLITRPTHRL